MELKVLGVVLTIIFSLIMQAVLEERSDDLE